MEVLAEKMLLAAQDLFQTTAELKRRAFLANAGKQLAKIEKKQNLVELNGRIASLECELAEAEQVSTCRPLPSSFCVRQFQALQMVGRQQQDDRPIPLFFESTCMWLLHCLQDVIPCTVLPLLEHDMRG